MPTELPEEKCVAILGGGYNPPTLAYERIVRAALSKERVDEVWLMPYRRRPFGKFLAVTFEHRFAMAGLMAHSLGKGIVATDLEYRRQGKSYTIDTVRELHRLYPHVKFYWLIGSDLLYELEDWKDIEQLKEMITFWCVVRPGYPVNRDLVEYYRAELLLGAKQMPDVSASEARRRISQDKSTEDLIPPYIADYIRKQGLYE